MYACLTVSNHKRQGRHWIYKGRTRRQLCLNLLIINIFCLDAFSQSKYIEVLIGNHSYHPNNTGFISQGTITTSNCTHGVDFHFYSSRSFQFLVLRKTLPSYYMAVCEVKLFAAREYKDTYLFWYFSYTYE